ncbi:MAG: hypothetical protein PHC95_15645 [Parabacteroides sp.]|nr:hypothetical protein [Parabacteroides sp.]
MRAKFFPGQRFDSTLEYAAVKNGSVIHRAVLDQDVEAVDGEFIKTEYCASLQERSDGSMAVLYSKWNTPSHARRGDGYYCTRLNTPEDAVPILLPLPATMFCLAGPRVGNLPSDKADVFFLAGEEAYYSSVYIP